MKNPIIIIDMRGKDATHGHTTADSGMKDPSSRQATDRERGEAAENRPLEPTLADDANKAICASLAGERCHQTCPKRHEEIVEIMFCTSITNAIYKHMQRNGIETLADFIGEAVIEKLAPANR